MAKSECRNLLAYPLVQLIGTATVALPGMPELGARAKKIVGAGMSLRAATCIAGSDMLSLHTVCASDALDTAALAACSVLRCSGAWA